MVSFGSEDMLPSNFGYDPWLIQLHGTNKQTQTFVNPFDGSLEERIIPEMQGKLCLGCFGDYLLLLDALSKECFFLNLASLEKIHLPPILEPLESLVNCNLSSSLTSLDCTIIFVCRRFILYCQPNNKEWTKLQMELDDLYYILASIIYKGKLYAYLTEPRIIVIDLACLVSDRLEWATIDFPQKWSPSYFSYAYFVESCGDIFFVTIYLYGDVTNFDVHRLESESSELVWKRVESINNHSFFLNQRCGISFSLDDTLAQRDCMYFVTCNGEEREGFNEERLYEIRLDGETKSFSVLLTEATKFWNTLYWVMPTRTKLGISRSSTATELNEISLPNTLSEDHTNFISKKWVDLPTELVELLLSRLSLVDCLRLPAVCKNWGMISYCMKEAKVWPWLMYRPIGSGVFKFFDPLYDREYTLECDVFFPDEKISLRFSKRRVGNCIRGQILCLHNQSTNGTYSQPSSV